LTQTLFPTTLPKDPLALVRVSETMLPERAAAWNPARRALAVDPLVLLREE
jgi:hypothetical protein